MFQLHRKALLSASAVAALALGSVLVLAAPASASDLNEPPVTLIAGSATSIIEPNAVAVGPDGTTWVADDDSTYTTGSLLGFASGATGNTAPEYDITGSNTGLESPYGVALDSSGNIWVAEAQAKAIYEFPADSTGNVAPIDTIAGPDTGFGAPTGLAVAPDGTIYVAVGNSIEIFGSGASGDASPEAVIQGPDTGLDTTNAWSLALESDGSLVVGGYNATIETFAPGASGDAAPESVIAGPATQLGTQLVVAADSSGDIFTIGAVANTVLEFAADANGNISPTVTLGGPSSDLYSPYALTIDSTGRLYVTNGGSGAGPVSIAEFNQPFLSISGISPASGPQAGGETVTITGVGFTAGSTVTFDGVPATDVVVVSSTEITAVVPPHASGVVDVAVVPPYGCGCQRVTATLVGEFTYDPALATTGVDPTPGIVAGIILFAIGAVLLLVRRRIVHHTSSL